MNDNPKYTDVMKPEDINIAHLWTVFAGMVLDPAAPALQRTEMRKAFYAGFSECFKIMVDLSDTLTEAQAAQVLSRLNDETAEFFQSFMEATRDPSDH